MQTRKLKWGTATAGAMLAVALFTTKTFADDQCVTAAAEATAECSVAAVEAVACSEGDVAACFSAPEEGAACVDSVQTAVDYCSNDSSSSASDDSSSGNSGDTGSSDPN